MPVESFWAALDRRLDPASPAPLAVGVSGGGDSLALLLLAADWARAHGRRLVALHVDHRINPQSAAWADGVAAAAKAAGADFRGLVWEGEKPRTGLSAAARAARHARLADAARAEGAAVILLGHTLDDLREAALMRSEGSSVGAPREWAPSPAWPQGRGVFLLRPLLGVSRAALRALLSERGAPWIEDPANSDPRFARSRARAALAGGEVPPDSEAPPDSGAPGPWRETGGALILSRSAAAALPPAQLAAACLCAAGGSRPPRGDRLAHLVARLADRAVFTASLAGARIEAGPDQLLFAREAGEAARGGLAQIALAAGETAVWDGRFEVQARAPVRLRALSGLSTRLDPAARSALAGLPAAARKAAPAAIDDQEQVSCPLIPGEAAVAQSLVLQRLLAFCGAFGDEAELCRGASSFPSHGEKA